MPDYKPWEEYPKIWKTKAEYYACVKGLLRKCWSNYPARNDWKASQLKVVDSSLREELGFSKRTKKCGQCALCNEWFPGSSLEVDHKQSSNGCTNKQEAEQFLWYCVGGTGEDWQLVCKPCHKIKTYSERTNVSFEEALIEKKIIAWEKDKSIQHQEYLLSLGYTKEQTSNAKKRRDCYREVLLNDK